MSFSVGTRPVCSRAGTLGQNWVGMATPKFAALDDYHFRLFTPTPACSPQQYRQLNPLTPIAMTLCFRVTSIEKTLGGIESNCPESLVTTIWAR